MAYWSRLITQYIQAEPVAIVADQIGRSEIDRDVASDHVDTAQLDRQRAAYVTAPAVAAYEELRAKSLLAAAAGLHRVDLDITVELPKGFDPARGSAIGR